MNSEPIHAFALQSTQRLSWDSFSYDMLIINSDKLHKKSGPRQLQQAGADGPIQEDSIKRAGHFTYLITRGFNISSICQRVNIGQAITDAMKAIEAHYT